MSIEEMGEHKEDFFMINLRYLTIAAIILSAALIRMLPHPPNFAPIMAIALFGGAHFASRRVALLVPLGAMLLSDLIIGFHSLMWAVYLCFVVTVYIGLRIREERSVARIAVAAFASSALFFFGTNYAVWAMTPMYEPTFSGLLTCYVAAIPFFHQTLMGTAFYTVLLFGGFAIAERLVPVLRDPQFARS